MRILGIDPGLRTTGFGVVDVNGAELRYVASGTISTQQLETKALPARLKVLYDGIAEVVQRYQPTCACIEIVFVNVNPQSTLLLGQARGALITALVATDLPVHEYTALQMKQAVVGYAADALGLAITHAHAGKAMARLAAADGLGGGAGSAEGRSATGVSSGKYKAGRSR